MPKLTSEQIEEIKKEMVKWRYCPEPTSADPCPVRFLIGGQCLNIETGNLQQKGINVIYQQVYWNFTKETSKKIAKWLGAKPVFDQS